MPKYSNFGSTFKDYFLILLSLSELLSIFTKKKKMILMIKNFENLWEQSTLEFKYKLKFCYCERVKVFYG